LSSHAFGWVIVSLLVAIAAAVAGFFAGYRFASERPRDRRKPAASDEHPHRRLTDKLLDLESIKVDDIMIPRNEIAYIDISDD